MTTAILFFFFMQQLQFTGVSCLRVINVYRKCEQPMAANEKFRNNVVMEMAPVNTAKMVLKCSHEFIF